MGDLRAHHFIQISVLISLLLFTIKGQEIHTHNHNQNLNQNHNHNLNLNPNQNHHHNHNHQQYHQEFKICTGAYGEQPCVYLPAAPGKTPPCALPGLTYCEHIEQYPGERIKNLISKWRFDHSTFFQDESRDDFSSYYYPPPTYKYGPYGNNLHHPDSYFPEPIYIPKPHFTFDETSKIGGRTYIPPPVTFNNFTGYPDDKPAQPLQLVSYKYSNNDIPGQHPQQQAVGSQNYYSTLSFPDYGQKVWGRKNEGLYLRKKRSAEKSIRPTFKELVTKTTRSKRQSITGNPLCPTRSQFIMPKAALNNKGNWMYVVNMPEVDNRFTQLVKSETCISQTCSSLCGLPSGVTSRCEQKYIQKRLVALEGTGNDLYNDVFWFPSCCICTLSNS